jgi:GT2 family glycosyltransferase
VTVVVADNGPSKSDLAELRELYRDNPIVRFETMPTNLGYFGAAHLALNTVWKERLPDWIIVSNADIRLTQPGFFSQIRDCPTGVGSVIAPRIVSARTGLDQNPFHRKRPSALRMNLVRIIPRVPLLFWMLETQCSVKRAIRSWLQGKHAQPATDSASIYAPHGAFIIFSREYFERGGSLNVGAFLYAEEIFVAETCRRLGLNVTYLPSIEVLHDEHVSTKVNPAIRGFQAEAADYCVREFFG